MTTSAAAADPAQPNRPERRRRQRDEQREGERRSRLLGALGVICPTGPIHIRTSKRPGVGIVAGFFTNDDEGRQACANAILPLVGLHDVWVCLNGFNPAVCAIAAWNRVGINIKCVTDKAILSRRWILVDFDPRRAANTASTAVEHDAAIKRAYTVHNALIRGGFPRDCLAIADSGNGAHIYVKVELENTKADGALVVRFLRAISLRWGDDVVEIDESVANASRMVKLPGTIATKGDDTDERPHREAELLEAPVTFMTVPTSLIDMVAGWAPAEEKKTAATAGDEWPDIEQWCAQHGLGIRSSGDLDGGRKHILDACPFDPSHDNGAALLIQWPSRIVTFRCLHNSCSTKDWVGLRDLHEPGWRQAWKDAQLAKSAGSADLPYPAPGRAADHADAPPAVNGVDLDQALRTLDGFEAVEAKFLWRPYIAEEALTILGGDYGTAKTWVILSVVAARTRGWGLPDGKTARIGTETYAPERALILTAENDPATLRFRIDRLGGDPSLVTIWDTRVAPLPNLTDLGLLDAALERAKPRLLVIDPLQSALGPKVDINRANEVRALLDRLVSLARKHACAVVVVMHLNKASTLSAKHRLMGSVDFAAAARSILIAAPLPDETSRRALVHLKCSVAREGASLSFALEGDDRDVTFTWGDQPLDVNLEEILQAPAAKRTETRVGQACTFLRDLLRGGAKSYDHIMEEAEGAGLSEGAIKRAGAILKVRKASFGFPRKTTWEMTGGII